MAEGKADKTDAPMDMELVAEALENDRFKQFLDHVPVAVAVSELQPSEIVTYANLEFQRLTGLSATDIEGKSWRTLPGIAAPDGDERLLGDAIRNDSEYIGTFTINRDAGALNVDVWSNTIEDDAGKPIYRLVAMAFAPGASDQHMAEALPIQEKDLLLKELQHRVKNNLQMITALIRIEARNLPNDDSRDRFTRLAGRINALGVLYDALSRDKADDHVDLGSYLGQIATSVMQAHATEGIRLDTKIDSWPVSVNVAMPAGLVVNEVLTNALKHAFIGREGGTITLHCLVDEKGCHITVADDGIGLPEGAIWPKPGKLSAVIVQSLKQNAGASVFVDSHPGKGVAVKISFAMSAMRRPQS